MRNTFQLVQLNIARARASADGIRGRSEDDRKMLAAFDSLALAVELLNDEIQRGTRQVAATDSSNGEVP